VIRSRQPIQFFIFLNFLTMKNAFFLLLLSLLFGSTLYAQGVQEGLVPNQYIVLFKATAAAPTILTARKSEFRDQEYSTMQVARNQNLSTVGGVITLIGIRPENVSARYADVVVGFAATLTSEQVDALRRNPSIESVNQDEYYTLINGVKSPISVEEPNAQQTTCAITNAGGFQDGSAKSTWIWILDTGIDLDHPDLNVQTSTTFAKSFVPGQTADDGNGHGTHCAGISAAKNNTIGVVGVSAGAKVVPVKVLSNSGSGQWSYLLSGLNHVAAYDIPNDVVNMSLGANTTNCLSFQTAIRTAIINLGNAGVWVCIAAGNNGCDANKSFPGCINGNRILTNASMECNQTMSAFSNLGVTVIDWVTTGGSVYSTFKDGGYTSLSGTSMATPVVAGICHAKAALPVSGGNITSGNSCVPPATYKKAKRI
jgi:subtilisin family serine protease